MRRDKRRIRNHDRFGAGTRLTGNMPGVVDGIFRLRNQQKSGTGCRPLLTVGEERADDDPLRIVDIRYELPASMDEKAAVHHFRRTRWGVRHAGERIRIAPPYIVLSRFRKTGDQPLMDRTYRAIPRGRCAAAAQLGDDVDEGGEAV